MLYLNHLSLGVNFLKYLYKSAQAPKYRRNTCNPSIYFTMTYFKYMQRLKICSYFDYFLITYWEVYFLSTASSVWVHPTFIVSINSFMILVNLHIPSTVFNCMVQCFHTSIIKTVSIGTLFTHNTKPVHVTI